MPLEESVMVRSLRMFLLSSIALLPAIALSATPRTDAERQAAAKVLAEATAACDTGAAAPLDPDARAPALQYFQLFPADFDRSKLKPLQAACHQAWAGAPGERRLQLQWLRVTVAMGEPGVDWTIPQLKLFADAGSAEAQYLMYQMFSGRQFGAESARFRVSRPDAIGYLKAAGEQGHLGALMELAWQYRFGPLLRRDPQMSVKMARRLESAPPQGVGETPYERQVKAGMPMAMALTTLEGRGFSQAELKAAFRLVEAAVTSSTDRLDGARLIHATALRRGIGTRKDPARARRLIEAMMATDQTAAAIHADMLARGEGGPADLRQALAMLRDEKMQHNGTAQSLLAGLLLDGKVIGRQPQEAIQALARAGDLDTSLQLAALLLDYQPTLAAPDILVKRLDAAILAEEPGAAIALARLKLSDNGPFSDVAGARALLAPLAEAGDRQAVWLYAGSQYLHLGSTSYQPYRQEGGLSDSDLKRLVEEGMARKEAEAYLLAAKFLRRGVVYPQDDQAATGMLVEAARRGNVEAMVLLGNAHDDGLGTAKNARERTRLWRQAAALGSLPARKKLASAFTFDTFDKLLTLREGVTGRLVLYINGVDRRLDGIGIGGDTMAKMEFMGLFSGRAMEAGTDALASAVMDAFREAPAGLDDRMLVGIGKALPDEVRAAIERRLKQQGFFQGEPQGYFGPEARAALADWVYATGPLAAETAAEAKTEPRPAGVAGALAVAVVDRVRDRVFAAAKSAKSDSQKIAALKKVNALARYGDLAARWVLVRNYHQARVVRKAVSPAEISRYGLDILVKRPAGMDKAEFEFIFDITQIAQDGKSGAFGQAMLDAVRDDPTLQDPLTLGGVMKQLIFAPEACDAVLQAARKAGVDAIGSDGCDEQTMTALIAFAKANGPAGIEAKARAAAANEIRAMDGNAAE